jgi:hypothetical protein
MGTKPKQSGTRHCGLRFPAFITLAPSVTRCSRCPGQPLILAAVIDGLERRLDPLPLSVAGLQAAVASRRYVAVVRPFAEPLATPSPARPLVAHDALRDRPGTAAGRARPRARPAPP